MGRPAEHVKQSLTNLVMKIASDKGVKLISKEIHEPVKIETSKDLFSSFAEVSLELDSIANYFKRHVKSNEDKSRSQEGAS